MSSALRGTGTTARYSSTGLPSFIPANTACARSKTSRCCPSMSGSPMARSWVQVDGTAGVLLLTATQSESCNLVTCENLTLRRVRVGRRSKPQRFVEGLLAERAGLEALRVSAHPDERRLHLPHPTPHPTAENERLYSAVPVSSADASRDLGARRHPHTTASARSTGTSDVPAMSFGPPRLAAAHGGGPARQAGRRIVWKFDPFGRSARDLMVNIRDLDAALSIRALHVRGTSPYRRRFQRRWGCPGVASHRCGPGPGGGDHGYEADVVLGDERRDGPPGRRVRPRQPGGPAAATR